MKNKKGWIKIIEAFLAILLVAGVLLVVVTKGYVGQGEISSRVYDAEVAVLREIELNDDLRFDILNAELNSNNEITWAEFDTKLIDVKERIESRIPNYLECKAKVCELDKICSLEEHVDANVYAKAVAITATIEKYNPRQLKLFCTVG